MKERAYNAWEIRHRARLTARARMRAPVEVQALRARDQAYAMVGAPAPLG